MINSTIVGDEISKGNIILSTLKDISAQKRADQEIEKLHKHLEDIIESSPSAIITLNESLAVTSINSSAEKFFAIQRVAALQKQLVEAIPFFLRYEKSLKKIILEKQIITLPSESFTIDENEEKYTNITFYPLLSEETGSIAIHLEDITGQVQLERQLFQSQKMDALGTLASGFAHDFNNLLSGMSSYISVLKMRTKDKNILERLNILENITQRASSLVSHILTFSRNNKIHAQAVNTKSVCDEVVNIISRSIPKNIKINNKVKDKNIFVKGDPSQISQVLLNLCINARDAMPDGGKLAISQEIADIREEDVTRFHMLKSGKMVKITVKDSGKGIPYEIKDRIFDPFFTTKSRGKGTGMGLAIVYGILQNHHGDVNVVSIPGKGTTVSFYLPIADNKNLEIPLEKPPTETPILKGKGTILIIDDEEVICNAVSDGLTRFGYHVYTANNGEQGISMFNEHKIDLIILDMIMPGISGEQTFDLLKKEDPNVKVMIHTGYTHKEIQERMMSKGALQVVNKPYDIFEMARLVSHFLSELQDNEPEEDQ